MMKMVEINEPWEFLLGIIFGGLYYSAIAGLASGLLIHFELHTRAFDVGVGTFFLTVFGGSFLAIFVLASIIKIDEILQNRFETRLEAINNMTEENSDEAREDV